MKQCILPTEMSKELAEEIGIHVGDGNLCFCSGNTYKSYAYSISSNSNEYDYQNNHIKPLIKRLYGLDANIWKSKNRNEIKLQYKSKILYYYKLSIGLPTGKKNNITVPKVILESEFVTDFLRGLFDTDGHLQLHCRNMNKVPYPRLDICSKSKELMEQVTKELDKLGFKANLIHSHQPHYKTGVMCHQYRVFMYGRKNLEKWIELIGFSNPKNNRKIELWKKLVEQSKVKKAEGGI